MIPKQRARWRYPKIILAIVGACFCVINAAEADPLLEPRPIAIDPSSSSPQAPRQPLSEGWKHAAGISDVLLSGKNIGLNRSAPEAIALWIRWDNYRTLIVIERAGGRELPAWIATYDVTTAKLAVAYRAVARQDSDGMVRVDARRAMISGPQAWEWSPDSFAIGLDDMISTHDDDPTHPSNHGEIEKRIDSIRDAVRYRQLLREVQSFIGDGI